jgi:hypothetical protein
LKSWMILLLKYAMTFVAGFLTLSLIDGNSVLEVLVLALAVAALNYGVGDLVVLPAYGNLVAAIGDGLMAAVLVYIISLIWPAITVSFLSLVIFAVLIAIAEYFLHNYLLAAEEVKP